MQSSDIPPVKSTPASPFSSPKTEKKGVDYAISKLASFFTGRSRSSSLSGRVSPEPTDIREKLIKEFGDETPFINRFYSEVRPLFQKNEKIKDLFYKEMRVILSDPDLLRHYEKFFSLFSVLSEKKIELVNHPGEQVLEIERLDFELGKVEVDIRMYCMEQRIETALARSLSEVARMSNTQLFCDYTKNPLYAKESEYFQFPRVDVVPNETLEEKALDGLGYYRLDNLFLWGYNGFTNLKERPDPNNAQQKIVEVVDYTTGIAIPGLGAYEMYVTVDFRPFLGEGATFEQAEELFQLFKEFAAARTRESLSELYQEALQKFSKGQSLLFFNGDHQKFDQLMLLFAQFFGTEESIGEVERKLLTCVALLRNPTANVEENLVISKEKVLECFEALIEQNPQFAEDKRIPKWFEYIGIKHLDKEIFQSFYNAAFGLQTVGKNVDGKGIVRELYAIVSDIRLSKKLFPYINALRTGASIEERKEALIKALDGKYPEFQRMM